MFNINRVVIVGRLTRDPELRALPSGASVCSLRVACNSHRKDADGDHVERPNYFDVSVYGVPGENVARHVSRGSRVGVDGRLEWREWETAAQERRQAVSIVADTVQFLDPAGERGPRATDTNESPLGSGEDPDELLGVGLGSPEQELVF
jgi:single-strand DNA-binding protein